MLKYDMDGLHLFQESPEATNQLLKTGQHGHLLFNPEFSYLSQTLMKFVPSFKNSPPVRH